MTNGAEVPCWESEAPRWEVEEAAQNAQTNAGLREQFSSEQLNSQHH